MNITQQYNVIYADGSEKEHVKSFRYFMITDLQNKLLTHYQNEHVKTWLSPLATRANNVSIDKVYVHPQMFIEDLQNNSLDIYAQRNVQSYHDIFCNTDDDISLTEEEIEQSNDTNHRCHNKLKNIYIIGDVGTGKSALCKMMIYSWCKTLEMKLNGKSTDVNGKDLLNLQKLSSYEFMFYVQMCYIPGDIADILSMIICSLQGIASATLIQSIFNHESERCLIIIDGLDEWSQPEHSHPSLRHIKTGIPISNNVYNATILTTSNPSAKGILNLRCSQYDRKIRLVGIDENEIQKMVRQYIEAFDKGITSKTVTEMDFIKELKAANFPHPERTPLLLQQVLYMYCKGESIKKSITRIYTDNLNIIFAWHEEKEADQREELKNVPEDITRLILPNTLSNITRFLENRKLVFMLGKLAYHLAASGSLSLVFGRSTFEECDIPYDALSKRFSTIGLIVKENCPESIDTKTQVLFTHSSFRDYFAAVYLSSNYHKDVTGNITNCGGPVLEELFKRYNTVEKILQLSGILIMVCGLNPCLIENISKLVYSIVLTDSSRFEYITELEEGQIFYKGLNETQEIQRLTSKMLSDCHFTNSEEVHKISMVDIVLLKEVDLRLLNQIIPETVQSLNINKSLLNDDTLGIISRLTHIRILVVKSEEKTSIKTSTTEPQGNQPLKLLSQADSLIHAVLYNEGLDIDLSRHAHLQNVTLDKCYHIFISSVSSDLLHSCEIYGLVFSHWYFETLTSLFPQIKDLTLKNIKCDMGECKTHYIDLSANQKLHSFILEDCNDIFPIISRTGVLESITICRCRLSHEQHHKLFCNIKETSSLNKVKVESLYCDVDCTGHNIDLSGKQHIDELCLENCKHVGFESSACSEIKNCKIRDCILLHEQCQNIARILTKTESLDNLELVYNSCSVTVCDQHRIDLSNHKHLQRIQYTDKCLYPYKLNVHSLQKLVICVSGTQIVLQQNLINASVLTEIIIEAISKNAVYNKQINSEIQTLLNLKRFELHRVDIEKEALSFTSRMKRLNYIKLWVVKMSQSTWQFFVRSLGKLSQNVNVTTISMVVTSNDDRKSILAYMKRNAGKFQVTQDLDSEFSFTSKGCELKISEC